MSDDKFVLTMPEVREKFKPGLTNSQCDFAVITRDAFSCGELLTYDEAKEPEAVRNTLKKIRGCQIADNL